MAVTHFGTYIAITHKAFDGEVLPYGLHDVSMELAVWLHAKYNDNNRGMLNATSFLDQPRLRAMNERSLVAATRGYRPQLASIEGMLSTSGSLLAQHTAPLIDRITANDASLWDPANWREADELMLTANIPIPAVKLLNLFFTAVTRTERKFAETRRADGAFDDFRIPGQNVLTNGNTNTTNNPNPDPSAPKAHRRSELTPYLAIPTSTLNTLHTETTQHFDENSTYMMQTAMGEGSSWQAWIPVAIFQPGTRNMMKFMYRLGVVDLRAFSTGGRGRPRLIIRPSSVGERMLRHLAQENMLS